MNAAPTTECWGCGHIHADGPGRCWEVACAPNCPAHVSRETSAYQSPSAQLLRSVTKDQPVVWTPETGWTA